MPDPDQPRVLPEGPEGEVEALREALRELEQTLLAVRTEPVASRAGWLMSNTTMEKVRCALEGDLAWAGVCGFCGLRGGKHKTRCPTLSRVPAAGERTVEDAMHELDERQEALERHDEEGIRPYKPSLPADGEQPEEKGSPMQCDGGMTCPAEEHVEGCYTGEGYPGTSREQPAGLREAAEAVVREFADALGRASRKRQAELLDGLRAAAAPPEDEKP